MMDRSLEFTIRIATAENVEDILALVRACADHMQSKGIEQWDELYPDRKTIESDVRSGSAFVATGESGVVGAVVLDELQDPSYAEVAWRFTAGPTAVVHRLMVHPSLQGRGIGRNLMEFTEEQAKHSGYSAIRLDAFTDNPQALRLYGRLGYRNAGTIRLRKGYFSCFEKELRVG